MLNILLAFAIVLAAFAWRRTNFWLPRFAPLDPCTRRRLLVLGGCLIAIVAVGYAAGDIVSGRTQVSKAPVRYATRLQGANAHHHELQNASRFWEQVLMQCGVGYDRWCRADLGQRRASALSAPDPRLKFEDVCLLHGVRPALREL